MACVSNLLASGIGLNCDTGRGGISKLYLAEHQNVDSYTLTAGEVTAITMVTDETFFEFVPTEKSVSQFTENATINRETGSTFHTQTLTFQLSRRAKEKAVILQTLIAGQKPLAAIVLDNNGIYWFLGLVEGVQVSALDGGSGTGKDTLNGYTISLEGQEADFAPEVDSTIIAGLL